MGFGVGVGGDGGEGVVDGAAMAQEGGSLHAHDFGLDVGVVVAPLTDAAVAGEAEDGLGEFELGGGLATRGRGGLPGDVDGFAPVPAAGDEFLVVLPPRVCLELGEEIVVGAAALALAWGVWAGGEEGVVAVLAVVRIKMLVVHDFV